MSEQPITLTRANFAAVAQKLEQFSQGLPPSEQAALAELLRQAVAVATGDSDVQGYDLASIPVPEGDLLRAFGAA